MQEPPLVERAVALAARTGFGRSCTAEVGRLLHVLAAGRGRSRVGEIGTGVGVGSAWLASALSPGVPLFTCELDGARAEAARRLFAADRDVRVLCGHWRDVLAPEAPFDLLFVDATDAKADHDVPGLLAPGGTALLDDLTPGRPVDGDPVRELWLRRSDVVGTELLTAPDSAAIVAVRLP
jgi:predicted O-methyltransferase YrrM